VDNANAQRKLPKRFDLSIFNSLIIEHTPEIGKGRFKLSLTPAEDAEVDRRTQEEWEKSYAAQYQRAWDEANRKWYPYRVAGVLDSEMVQAHASSTVDEIMNHWQSSLRQQIVEQFINERMTSEICRAMGRRDMYETRYDTDWGFRVKSRGEQAIANALRFYTITYRDTGECQRISLLYEPLFRIPDENRIVIPDFVIPEYGVIIEYAGVEERNYKVGLILKIDAFKRLGIPVVVMVPGDLQDGSRALHQKIKFYFNLNASETRPF
jgi:hypothetical protein